MSDMSSFISPAPWDRSKRRGRGCEGVKRAGVLHMWCECVYSLTCLCLFGSRCPEAAEVTSGLSVVMEAVYTMVKKKTVKLLQIITCESERPEAVWVVLNKATAKAAV